MSPTPALAAVPRPHSPRTVAALRELAGEAPLHLRSQGACMVPVLPDGARLEVAARRRYWPGDVIVFAAQDGRLLVHRVAGWRWRQGRREYITRADRAHLHDAPVDAERVIGRVVGGEDGARAARVTPGDRVAAVAWLAGYALRRLTGRP